MDTIQLLLAKLFDGFKAKNPLIAAIILGLIAGFLVVLQNYDIFGDKTDSIITWVLFVLAALTGSRTTQTISNASEKKTNL